MLIYDKKDGNIDVYKLEAKKEELEKYKRKSLEGSKDLFYTLSTNYKYITKYFSENTEMNYDDICFDKEGSITYGNWATLVKNDSALTPNQFETIEEYIAGYYDDTIAKRVYINEGTEQLNLYYFLCDNWVREYGNKETIYEHKDLFNIPYRLYLLHNFFQGNMTEKSVNEAFNHQDLFDISFLNSVKIDDIQNVLSTGLVNGSMEEIDTKIKSGSKLLKRIRG